MSVDYYLYKNDNRKVTVDELERHLLHDYLLTNLEADEDGIVRSFTIKSRDESSADSITFVLQETGEYWAFTYSYEDQPFQQFVDQIADVADKLDMVISDPQENRPSILPAEFKSRGVPEYVQVQKNFLSNLPGVLENKKWIKRYYAVNPNGGEIKIQPADLKDRISDAYLVTNQKTNYSGFVVSFSVTPKSEKTTMSGKLLSIDFEIEPDAERLVASCKTEGALVEQVDFGMIYSSVIDALGLDSVRSQTL